MKRDWRRRAVCKSMGLAALLVLSGCAVDTPGTVQQQLTGQEWQLLSIQSMDDAQGTTRISSPAMFSMRLEPDGKASWRLDCNRAFGTYTLQPAADGVSGAIQFTPIGMTRALCAPPHLDERVARDLPLVRGYLLRDGRLYLSLYADGGIYEWAKAGRQP